MSVGARCPACKSRISRVIETRTDGDTIRRRRDCTACHARWTTSEELVEGSLVLSALVKRPREPKVKSAPAPVSKPVSAAPKSPAKPRRQKTLDDLTAEEEFINTDDDVRAALGGIIHGR